METITCRIHRVRYQEPGSGFCIALMQMPGEDVDTFTALGTFPIAKEGMHFELTGEWVDHPIYGKQFRCDSVIEQIPQTQEGMEVYLSSGLIKGIGPVYASRILHAFGKDTFDVIDQHPEKLLNVKGIGLERVNKIIESWNKQKEIRNVMVYLQSVGVSSTYAVKIFKRFGKQSIEKVKQNPYCLTDIWGIGFKLADGIAQNMGIAEDSLVRCKSGLLYTIDVLNKTGHVYVTREQLVKTAGSSNILNVADYQPIYEALNILIENEEIICDTSYESALYLPTLYQSEVYVANKLLRMVNRKINSQRPSETVLAQIEQKLGISYDIDQKEAICMAATSQFLVLTGGPGTGKTTVINGILQYLEQKRYRILLAAPTGRAAQRMSEVTKRTAQTIHRLLEFGGKGGFLRNEDTPLEGDVLVLDETSMIDISLMESLLRAVPEYMKVIMVGDVDQLPSVGPGCVLRDLISSEVLPVVRLTKIFRQAQTSDIVMNAHRINEGKSISLTNSKDSDFFWCMKEDPVSVQDTIVDYVAHKLPKYYKVDPLEIQVLAPMKKGLEGVDNLNLKLQDAINPSSLAIPFHGHTLRIHDKVMQLRNNYDKNVFNGDVGIVESIDQEENVVTISFSGTQVIYDRDELDELTLSYACTIHKSQGSEYQIVVMPITTSHWIMLQRNLLYTAVTRAKRIFVAVGSRKAFEQAIRHIEASKRNTMLQERLRENAIQR